MKLVLCSTVMLLAAVLLSATVYTVPGSFSTIQAALNACVSGDVVNVAAGVYHENLVWPSIDGITLNGASRETTIVDGSGAGRVLTFPGSWSSVVITDATHVSNITLRNGFNDWNGVGMYCNYASPTVENCIISHNKTSAAGMTAGGGAYFYGSYAHLTNVIFAKNTAYSGGGVHVDPSSSPIFTNCVFADNTLMSPGGSYAAGIYARYTSPQFIGCTVTRNRYYSTAGIHIGEYCNIPFTNCTITDNYDGFRFAQSNTGMVATGCTIAGNEQAGIVNAASGGGVINAAGCYWGSDSGPEHTTNPTGTGDLITGSALFTPWLPNSGANTPPRPPRNLSAVATGTSVTLTWDAVPEAVSYVVNYGVDSLMVIHPQSSSGVYATATINCPVGNLRYYFQVRAMNDNAISGWYSSVLPVDVGAGLGSPTVTVTRSGGNTVLNWTAVPGASVYRIESATDPWGTFTFLHQTGALLFTDPDSSPAKRFYRVIAIQ